MQRVRTLDKDMPRPVAPHKHMPNLWSVGALEGGLSPGMPWHPWGGPHLPELESEMSTGMPWCHWRDPTSPQNPSPTLRELFQWWGPGSSPLALVPDRSSELRVDGVVAKKKKKERKKERKYLLYSRHWSCFLTFNFLPLAQLKTHNSQSRGSLEFH